MARSELEIGGATDVSVTVVTPEREPLWIFGEAAGAALRELLSERGIELRTEERAASCDRRRPMARVRRRRRRRHRDQPPAARRGRRSRACPRTKTGSCRPTPTGTSPARRGVLAAGDATTLPDQAGRSRDAAGRRRCRDDRARARRRRRAAPFAPVLRGLLLTGGAPLYLRAELDARGERRACRRSTRLRGEVSSHALWWPPGKVAGRYLAPYLSTARPGVARRRAAGRPRRRPPRAGRAGTRRRARARTAARRRGRGGRRPSPGAARARRGRGPGRRRAARRVCRAPRALAGRASVPVRTRATHEVAT